MIYQEKRKCIKHLAIYWFPNLWLMGTWKTLSNPKEMKLMSHSRHILQLTLHVEWGKIYKILNRFFQKDGTVIHGPWKSFTWNKLPLCKTHCLFNLKISQAIFIMKMSFIETFGLQISLLAKTCLVVWVILSI